MLKITKIASKSRAINQQQLKNADRKWKKSDMKTVLYDEQLHQAI